jgi:uncharacterized protein YdhG (YjbR/CyaY superfamily)
MKQKQPKNIDEYISDFPKDVQAKLQNIRTTIRKAAPDANEAIKYQMPTFVLNGKNLIHFAAYKNHIGLYPTYEGGKGTIQFPLDEPIRYSLITKIVKFRIKQSLENAKVKR